MNKKTILIVVVLLAILAIIVFFTENRLNKPMYSEMTRGKIVDIVNDRIKVTGVIKSQQTDTQFNRVVEFTVNSSTKLKKQTTYLDLVTRGSRKEEEVGVRSELTVGTIIHRVVSGVNLLDNNLVLAEEIYYAKDVFPTTSPK